MAMDNKIGMEDRVSFDGKERSRRFIYKIIARLKWYVLGVLTPFLVVACLAVLGVRPPMSKAELLFSEWGVTDSNNTMFLVNLSTEPNTWISIGLERDPETKKLKQIGITKTKGGQSVAFFSYTTIGTYNFPMAYYGFTDGGIVWRDLNADGIFDQKVDYRNREMDIYVDGQWIKGLGKRDVTTEQGIFVFDPNQSGWKKVVPKKKGAG